MIRRDFAGGSEMHFRYLTQCAWSTHFHYLFRSLFYVRGCSSLESQPKLFSPPLQPINESFPRQNRGRCHCDI